MLRISNTVIGILNAIFLLLGLASIGAYIYFHIHGGTTCRKVLQNPLLFTGLFFVVVSILGLAGSCGRINTLLYIYLVVMFSPHHRTHRVHRVRAFGDAQGDRTGRVGERKNLSPIQSGCCKPPSYCGFDFKNATYWAVPKSGPKESDSDCTSWSNKQNELCYDCKSCKGGVLANIRKEWRNLAILNCCIIILVTLVYCLGCCATKNNRFSTHNYNKYRGGP
ncbi:hypothetical protein M0R45_023449 [Rubus argutus]|uniref:Tetraspanin-11 n=1 Tax=Rubus argutus TaxID=59490 RepID=A0AAW1WS91_RUBAR